MKESLFQQIKVSLEECLELISSIFTKLLNNKPEEDSEEKPIPLNDKPEEDSEEKPIPSNNKPEEDSEEKPIPSNNKPEEDSKKKPIPSNDKPEEDSKKKPIPSNQEDGGMEYDPDPRPKKEKKPNLFKRILNLIKKILRKL